MVSLLPPALPTMLHGPCKISQGSSPTSFLPQHAFDLDFTCTRAAQNWISMLLVMQVTHGMFSRAVEDELDRILAFFRRKHDELQQRLQAILQQLTGGFRLQTSFPPWATSHKAPVLCHVRALHAWYRSQPKLCGAASQTDGNTGSRLRSVHMAS